MAIPRYSVTYDFIKDGENTMLHLKVSQAGVPSEFKMMVPLYLELENRDVRRLGKATLKGSSTVEQSVNLGKLTIPAKRVLVNYYYDLLSEP